MLKCIKNRTKWEKEQNDAKEKRRKQKLLLDGATFLFSYAFSAFVCILNFFQIKKNETFFWGLKCDNWSRVRGMKFIEDYTKKFEWKFLTKRQKIQSSDKADDSANLLTLTSLGDSHAFILKLLLISL